MFSRITMRAVACMRKKFYDLKRSDERPETVGVHNRSEEEAILHAKDYQCRAKQKPLVLGGEEWKMIDAHHFNVRGRKAKNSYQFHLLNTNTGSGEQK